jgi:hypothetical protein
MDREENFLKENRLRLDTEDLDATQWAKIAEYLNRKERYRVLKQVLWAAGFAGLVFLGGISFLMHNRNTTAKPVSGLFTVIANDLVKDESNYIQLINNAMDTIRNQTVPVEYAPLFKDFIKQLQILDNQYTIYKNQVEQHGYNQELIQQIIYNYQLKLSVLQSLQSEINKINQLTKRHEKTTERTRLAL